MLRKIISGGQTGADRGGLQAGKKLGLETGGTAPRGFRTEIGPDPSLREFGLTEHSSPHFGPRTICNVEAGDGTLWFGLTDTRGAWLTLKTAIRLDRPLLLNPGPGVLRQWIEKNHIVVLNIAGNRESLHPGLSRQVEAYIIAELSGRPGDENGSGLDGQGAVGG